MFDVDGLAVTLGGSAVLSEVSFRLSPGERVVLLGINGSGKTTLLKALDGLLAPSAGSIRWAGSPISPRALDDAALRRRFRGEVALLFQNVDAMLFNPTVADEIAFGPRQLGLPDVEGRVRSWARALRVDGLLERPPFDLSGGEKKRVALAAILAIDPKVLLLDEATANLDPASAAGLVDLLADLAGVAVLSSTQNLSIAEELGERALLLVPGRPGIRFEGPTADLLRDEALLVESGLAHRHAHRHGAIAHAHYHVHDSE